MSIASSNTSDFACGPVLELTDENVDFTVHDDNCVVLFCTCLNDIGKKFLKFSFENSEITTEHNVSVHCTDDEQFYCIQDEVCFDDFENSNCLKNPTEIKCVCDNSEAMQLFAFLGFSLMLVLIFGVSRCQFYHRRTLEALRLRKLDENYVEIGIYTVLFALTICSFTLYFVNIMAASIHMLGYLAYMFFILKRNANYDFETNSPGYFPIFTLDKLVDTLFTFDIIAHCVLMPVLKYLDSSLFPIVYYIESAIYVFLMVILCVAVRIIANRSGNHVEVNLKVAELPDDDKELVGEIGELIKRISEDLKDENFKMSMHLSEKQRDFSRIWSSHEFKIYLVFDVSKYTMDPENPFYVHVYPKKFDSDFCDWQGRIVPLKFQAKLAESIKDYLNPSGFLAILRKFGHSSFGCCFRNFRNICFDDQNGKLTLAAQFSRGRGCTGVTTVLAEIIPIFRIEPSLECHPPQLCAVIQDISKHQSLPLDFSIMEYFFLESLPEYINKGLQLATHFKDRQNWVKWTKESKEGKFNKLKPTELNDSYMLNQSLFHILYRMTYKNSRPQKFKMSLDRAKNRLAIDYWAKEILKELKRQFKKTGNKDLVFDRIQGKIAADFLGWNFKFRQLFWCKANSEQTSFACCKTRQEILVFIREIEKDLNMECAINELVNETGDIGRFSALNQQYENDFELSEIFVENPQNSGGIF